MWWKRQTCYYFGTIFYAGSLNLNISVKISMLQYCEQNVRCRRDALLTSKNMLIVMLDVSVVMCVDRPVLVVV